MILYLAAYLYIMWTVRLWINLISNTDLPAYSDTLGTWRKCHCNQIVTVSKGSLVINQSFGTCKKCHCKRGVTVNSVTVSGEICIHEIIIMIMTRDFGE